FDWPADGRLVVPGLYNEPRRAWMLSDREGRPLVVSREGDALVVVMPPTRPDAIDSVVALEVLGVPDVADAPAIEAETDVFVSTLDVRASSPRDHVQVRCTTDG